VRILVDSYGLGRKKPGLFFWIVPSHGLLTLKKWEGNVTRFFGDLTMSSKLMVAPVIFALFLLALGVVLYAGYPSTVSFSLIGAAIACSLAANFLVARNISSKVRKAIERVAEVSKGDLTNRINVESRDEIGEMSSQFNTFVGNLRKIMVHVSKDGDQILSASHKMQSAIEQMITAFEEIATQVNSIAVASEELSSTSSEIARNCTVAAESSKQSNEAVRAGGVIIDETVAVMKAIAEKVKGLAVFVQTLGSRSDQVGEVIGFITEIADQTNLLALNAAIEAARAGEHGRGFAVVADEVRKLAERTTDATREIGKTIEAMQGETKSIVASIEESVREVEIGTQKATRSKDFLNDISNQIDTVNTQINQIAVAVEQENTTTNQTSLNIHQLSGVMNDTSRKIHDTAPAALQMAQVAEALEMMMKQFKVE
jgi:methyl-accepting chemotaxis protein